MPKKEILTTPKGRALWPHVDVANTTFNADGVYEMDVVFDPKNNPEHKAFMNKVAKMVPEGGTNPWRKHKDVETGEETGMYTIHFKSQWRPKQFDAKGKLVEHESNLGNDSLVRVSFVPNPYTNVGGRTGVSFYLQAIQIIELVEYRGGDSDYYGFEEEDGYQDDPLTTWNDEDQKKADKVEEAINEQETSSTPPTTNKETEGLPF